MAHLILSREQVGRTVASANSSLVRRRRPIVNTATAKWMIRYAFYAFVFSLPFEASYLTSGTTLTKLFGLALAGLALLQASLCYKFPPRAFWCFASYVFIFALFGAYLIFYPPNIPEFPSLVRSSIIRFIQFLVLFWISFNLLKQKQLVNGMLWALAAGSILLATLQIIGMTSDPSSEGRVTAFEENPNVLATVLSLGLLALFGLAYGRSQNDWKARVLFWLASGILAVAIVQTGSRGAVVAVVGSLSIFFLRGKSLAMKLKFGVIALTGIVALAVASYQIDAVRKRWERTVYDADLAGRETIYAETIDMILESPLVGWGPVNHMWELGPRVGRLYRDEHNLYLRVLAEVGIVGAIPFFAGLWLCGRAAWKARHSAQGILPAAMLLFVLVSGLKGTPYQAKFFWVVLAYALASGVATRPGLLRMRSWSNHPGFGQRRQKATTVSQMGPRRQFPRSYPVPRA